MTRVQTTQYGALSTTQFQWATTDDDLFDRELDLYRLAQALEIHDHSSSHGLAVARVGAGVVDATAMAALAVGTSALQDLSVTNGKLAAGAVTRDKITYPLIQPTNDMAGGFRMRETANTYALGFYMAANGLAVFGAGTPATVGTNLILGQTGQVSVGASQGAAFFNIMQTTTVLGSGLRIYNSNTAFFTDFLQDGNGNLQLYPNGASVPALVASNTTAKISLGSTAQFTGRLNLTQGAGTQAEGYYQSFGGGNFSCFVDTNGDVNLRSATTSIMLRHASAALHPLTNANVDLGLTGMRWGAAYVTTLTATTSITTGSAVFGGAVSGITSLTIGGAFSGVTSMNHSGNISPTSDNASDVGNGSNRYAHLWAIRVNIGVSADTSSTLQLGSDSAAKPGTNTWTVSSDIRTKHRDSIRPYEQGLSSILRMPQPIFYRYNGLAGTPDMTDEEDATIGWLAEEVQPVAPELVRVGQARLHPTDEDMTDVLQINTHALQHMTVNAFKEIIDILTQMATTSGDTKTLNRLHALVEDRRN